MTIEGSGVEAARPDSTQNARERLVGLLTVAVLDKEREPVHAEGLQPWRVFSYNHARALAEHVVDLITPAAEPRP